MLSVIEKGAVQPEGGPLLALGAANGREAAGALKPFPVLVSRYRSNPVRLAVLSASAFMFDPKMSGVQLHLRQDEALAVQGKGGVHGDDLTLCGVVGVKFQVEGNLCQIIRVLILRELRREGVPIRPM